ncbi:MAG: HlyD family secretion protein [Crocinitomicaceae bacterium]|nr:HlyD family secretion protein [Crocinitomicaceae bacterium]
MPSNSKEHINLRSDEVQEIMNHVPNWMVRWGISMIFFLFILLISISYFIKYPDIIEGSVTISTEEPPIEMISKVTGEIESIYLENNSQVEKGEVIATVATVLPEESKIYLESTLDLLDEMMKTDAVISFEFKDEGLSFGGVQNTYYELKSNVIAYQFFLKNDASSFEIQNLKKQIENNKSLKSISNQQLSTAKKELENVKTVYDSDKRLYEEKVISKSELFEREKELISVENKVGNYKKAAVQCSITITDLEKQLYNLTLNANQEKEDFISKVSAGISAIKNYLHEWAKEYEFIAPVSGKLTYLKNINEFQHIETGEPLFAIVSENQNYVGFMNVEKTGFGKVKLGQKVKVKVDKYPEYQYGQLEGVITAISLLPNEDLYRVEFELLNGMVSTYGQEFEYSPEMSGTADVITEDVRLITRIFNKFRKAFN